jgi:hypothetical protein
MDPATSSYVESKSNFAKEGFYDKYNEYIQNFRVSTFLFFDLTRVDSQHCAISGIPDKREKLLLQTLTRGPRNKWWIFNQGNDTMSISEQDSSTLTSALVASLSDIVLSAPYLQVVGSEFFQLVRSVRVYQIDPVFEM